MSGGLHLIAGPAPFGGASLADRYGSWPSFRRSEDKETPVTTKTPRRRSTAQEAADDNSKKGPKDTAAVFASCDKTFRVCCLKAGIKPTKRQASKFRANRGAAYQQLASLTKEDFE